MYRLALLAIFVAVAHATVHFREDFDKAASRWVETTSWGTQQGKFRLAPGAFFGNASIGKGIQTSQDNRYYGISAKFTPFSTEGEELVFQFTVKFGQSIDCGGGYAKLYPSNISQSQLNGNTPYYIMFGPDICAPSKRKVQVILNYNGRNQPIKKEIRCKDDVYTHLYTLRLMPSNTYEVYIDNEKVEGGKLEDDWDLAPKQIEDPMVTIPDYRDDVLYGDLEEYAEEIDDSNNTSDPYLYRYNNIGAIGIEVWQYKSGTIFGNILVADSLEEAAAHAAQTWVKTKEAEKKIKELQERRQLRRRQRMKYYYRNRRGRV